MKFPLAIRPRQNINFIRAVGLSCYQLKYVVSCLLKNKKIKIVIFFLNSISNTYCLIFWGFWVLEKQTQRYFGQFLFSSDYSKIIFLLISGAKVCVINKFNKSNCVADVHLNKEFYEHIGHSPQFFKQLLKIGNMQRGAFWSSIRSG